MIQQIVTSLTNQNIKYLLIASIGITAKNIDSQIIYSILQIRNIQTYFETLSCYNDQQKKKLKLKLS